jgi:hypothetical protein
MMADQVKLIAPTGSEIIGLLTVVPGMVQLVGVTRPAFGDLVVDTGDETELNWDEQQQVEVNGKAVFVDEDGLYWCADQLIPEPDEEDLHNPLQVGPAYPQPKPVRAFSTFKGVFAWGWERGVDEALGAIMKVLAHPHTDPDDIAVAIEQLKEQHEKQS